MNTHFLILINCVNKYIYVCMCLHTYLYTYMDTIHIIRIILEWARMYVYTCICLYCVYTNMYVYVCTYRRICRCMNCNTTCVHTYIHMYLLICIFCKFNFNKYNIIAQSTQGSTAIDTSLILCIARRSAHWSCHLNYLNSSYDNPNKKKRRRQALSEHYQTISKVVQVKPYTTRHGALAVYFFYI